MFYLHISYNTFSLYVCTPGINKQHNDGLELWSSTKVFVSRAFLRNWGFSWFSMLRIAVITQSQLIDTIGVAKTLTSGLQREQEIFCDDSHKVVSSQISCLSSKSRIRGNALVLILKGSCCYFTYIHSQGSTKPVADLHEHFKMLREMFTRLE